MSGLMEQIKPENKKLYEPMRWPIEAQQLFASNAMHYYITTGKLTVEKSLEIMPLIQSEDPESISLGIIMMETLTGLTLMLNNCEIK